MLFLVAALFEIGGAWLVWQGVREHKGLALGRVLKDTDAEDFARAIVAVGRGEALFSRGIAARMVSFFAQRPASNQPFPSLTESERGVLRLMAAGANNSMIAHDLSLSSKIVRKLHLEHLPQVAGGRPGAGDSARARRRAAEASVTRSPPEEW